MNNYIDASQRIQAIKQLIGSRATHRLGLCALLLLILLPLGNTTAQAKDYCVGNVTQQNSCTGNPYSPNHDGLQDALDDASLTDEADRVLIGPYTITGQSFYQEDPDILISSPVEIIGAGQGKTVLKPPSGDSVEALSISDNSENLVRDLSCQIQTTTSTSCFKIFDGTIKNVAVTGSTKGSGSGIVIGEGAEANNLTVELSGDSSNVQGLKILNYNSQNTNTVTDSSITVSNKATGITNYAPKVTLSRIRVESEKGGGIFNYSPSNVTSTNTTIKDSLIRSPYYTGIYFNDNPAVDTVNLDVVRTTVVGDTKENLNTYEGIQVTGGLSQVTDVLVKDSIVSGYSKPFYCSESGGNSIKLTVKSTAYSETPSDNCSGDIDVSDTSNKPGVDPGFVNPTESDYRLLFNSPLIDAGSLPNQAENLCFGISCPLDLNGLARFQNGDGKGDSKSDMGAFEYQRQAPTVTASASPTVAKTGEVISFTGSGNDKDPGDQLTYTWNFDDGTQTTDENTTHTFQTPGTHTATLTATDPIGLTAKETVDITVAQPTLESATPKSGLEAQDSRVPKSKIAKLAKTAKADRLKVFRGTATDDQKVVRVDLAFVYKKGKQCLALKTTGKTVRYKTTKKTCSPKFFIRAKGTKNWSFKPNKKFKRTLTKLAKRKTLIQIYSRATDNKSQQETKFTTKLGNQRNVKLR